MTSSQKTIFPASVREKLYADSRLGSGNFLQKSHAAAPAPAADYLFLEEPFSLPDGTTYTRFSLDTLVEVTRRLAGCYLAAGIDRDEAVGVYVSEGIPAFLHFLALSSIGAIPALINPAVPPEVAAAYIEQNGFRRVTSDPAVQAATGIGALLDSRRLLDYARVFRSRALASSWPCEPDDDAIIMLCHTSGTTGLPKAVEFGHRQFFDGKRERLRQFLESEDDKMISAMPHSHSAGISYLMLATLLGLPTLVLSNLVGYPVRSALHRFSPTILVAFPQSFVSLAAGHPAPGEFSFVRRWFCMADASHESHIRKILAAAPRSKVIDTFGSSELGMALFRRVSTVNDVAHRRSIGRPVDFARASVLDPDTGEELPPGQPGLLAVRSPTLTPGYWRRPDLTAAARRNEYWLTGDIAYHVDGEFFHLDRTVDVIRSRVGPLYTLLLEEAIQHVEGVRDATVVGCALNDDTDESVVALVLVDTTASDTGDSDTGEVDPARVVDAVVEASRSLGRELPAADVWVAVAQPETVLPCGATGKVLKRVLRESFSEMHAEFRDTGAARGWIGLFQGGAAPRRPAAPETGRTPAPVLPQT